MDEAKMYAIVGGIMQYGVFATLLGLLVGKVRLSPLSNGAQRGLIIFSGIFVSHHIILRR